jgi:uncharacterized protein (TIGR02145 family)
MKILTPVLVVFLSISSTIQAQAPQKFSYQTVIRNNGGQLLANQQVSVKISVLQGSENGIVVFAERHTPTTNTNGLASLQIGTGTVLNGSFSNINWSQGPYFITTETDPNGGTSYTIVSTQQLLSVPYALYSGNGILGVSATGDSLFLGNGTSIIIPGISEANIDGNQTGSVFHSCGADSVHNPNLNYGTMTDQEGNVYKTIVIGTQEWMAENLKTSKYRNSETIANVTDNAQWANLTAGAWCYFNNDNQFDCPYGKLYNWYAVSDNRNLCPNGWHIPTDLEWNTLVGYLDPTFDPNAQGVQSNIAGSELKTISTQYWQSPNANSTNESGFSGIPGGQRGSNGGDGLIFDSGFFWSRTESSITSAWARDLGYDVLNIQRGFDDKIKGFSVRCLKD